MIPNIIRLQERANQTDAAIEVIDALFAKVIERLDIMESRLELQHAHIENLIERVYELEGGDTQITDDHTPGTLHMEPPAGHGESWGDAQD